jgi:hypothetical protein
MLLGSKIEDIIFHLLVHQLLAHPYVLWILWSEQSVCSAHFMNDIYKYVILLRGASTGMLVK